EKHFGRCLDARKAGDWKSVLRESDAAIAAGADSCALTPNCGFIANAYLFYVHAQVDMALGRFDHAVSSIDKARIIDPGNTEVVTMHNKVKFVARARSLGNELFNSGKFSEACWEKSIEDCNEALKIQPNYTKALLRRAASYGKMERWAEYVKDLETRRLEDRRAQHRTTARGKARSSRRQQEVAAAQLADSAHAQIYPPLTGVFKPLIKEGNVYNVSYIQIKKANRMYKPVDNDILIGFTKWILC
ncbi:hypothetical protein ACJX0J_029527, partial [Zea mays]